MIAGTAALLVGLALGDVELLSPARTISHASSASRDTFVLGLQGAPHRVLSAGGDVGFLSWFSDGGYAVRLGFQGMLDLESDGTSRPTLPFPEGDIRFWRGLWGYSVAVSHGDQLEGTVSFRHESEHYTGSNEGDGGTDYSDVPHIGDFVLLDVATRLQLRGVELVVRAQNKVFLPDRSGYVDGPGADVVVRWRRFARVQPFSSTFVEYLFGADAYPDAYQIRNLTGVVLPSPYGDIYLYGTGEVGHRKGLAVFTEEASLGFGIRFALL